MNILFIFLFFNVSAFQLSVSPPELELRGKTGEWICNNAYIFTDEVVKGFEFSDKWAKKGVISKSLIEHRFNAEEVGLGIKTSGNISEEGEFEICVRGSSPGRYHGAFMFRAFENNLVMGIWLNVNLGGEELLKREVSLPENSFLTGEIVREFLGGNKSDSSNFLVIALLGSTTFLLGVFCLLLIRVNSVFLNEKLEE